MPNPAHYLLVGLFIVGLLIGAFVQNFCTYKPDVIVSECPNVPPADAAAVENVSPKATAEVTPAWRWSPGRSCNGIVRGNLVLRLNEAELRNGKLSRSSPPANFQILKAAETFRACGVVVVAPGLLGIDSSYDGPRPSESFHGATNILAHAEAALNSSLAPLLASRSRVRFALKRAMVRHESLRELWHGDVSKLPSEAIFHSGRTYRERDDGRIDQVLPPVRPFNESLLTASPLIAPILGLLLGDKAELKSVHAVHALPGRKGGGSTARTPQHWHRDTELLFTSNGDKRFRWRDVHSFNHGVFLPPYGINAFVPMRSLTDEDGPTEFTLGSHMWGDAWVDWEETEAPLEDISFMNLPAGSVILSDYRTVHRGGVNRSKRTRTLLMLIYGRDWWEDRTNYDDDYGGVSLDTDLKGNTGSQNENDSSSDTAFGRRILRRFTTNTRPSQSDAVTESTETSDAGLRERMFWGLTSLWEAGLRAEIMAELAL